MTDARVASPPVPPAATAAPTPAAPGPWSSRWLIETTLLVLLGVLLAVATVHDVARQTHVNQRLIVDLATWRALTGHAYHNLSVEQDRSGRTTREVVCGNTAPGAPKTRPQLCLVMTGPVVHGRREVHGGYYLPPHLLFDTPSARYACFGAAKSQGLCRRRATPLPGTG
ncbi:MAG: hypothetical protein ACHQDY_05040 [Solirubrobacterales bacterium]